MITSNKHGIYESDALNGSPSLGQYVKERQTFTIEKNWRPQNFGPLRKKFEKMY